MNDNAAFPVPQEAYEDGLTKRELFAAMVAPSLIELSFTYSKSSPELGRAGWVAEQAVGYADAIIAELAKENP